MNGFTEVKTAELTGAALDWAVAVADEEEHPQVYSGVIYVNGPKKNALAMEYCPSTNWAQGGPLRDKYDVGIEPGVPDGLPYAYVPGRDLDGSHGETALIALCRAIVAAKMGDVVEVPVELVGVAA